MADLTGQPDGGDREPDPDADPYAVARAIVLRRLAAAPRSRAELAATLTRKNVPSEVGQAVLDRFEELGLVDDHAYAEMVVRTRHAERGLARRGLASELARRGVPRDVAEDALAPVDRDAEQQAAARLVAKRLPGLAGQPRPVAERRLAGMLARKGYPPGLIRTAVTQALDERAADERAADERGGPD